MLRDAGAASVGAFAALRLIHGAAGAVIVRAPDSLIPVGLLTLVLMAVVLVIASFVAARAGGSRLHVVVAAGLPWLAAVALPHLVTSGFPNPLDPLHVATIVPSVIGALAAAQLRPPGPSDDSDHPADSR